MRKHTSLFELECHTFPLHVYAYMYVGIVSIRALLHLGLSLRVAWGSTIRFPGGGWEWGGWLRSLPEANRLLTQVGPASGGGGVFVCVSKQAPAPGRPCVFWGWGGGWGVGDVCVRLPRQAGIFLWLHAVTRACGSIWSTVLQP